MNPARAAALLGRSLRRTARWRGTFYHRLFPGNVGKGCRFGRSVFLDGLDRVQLGESVILADTVGVVARAPGQVTIGAKTFINSGAIVSSTGEGVTIGYDCLLGPHVIVVDQNHAYDDPGRPIARQGMAGGGPVVIGDGAWVAAGVVVLGPTTVAPGSVVGANSVIKGHFPRRCVIAGAPAKVVRYLDEVDDERNEEPA